MRGRTNVSTKAVCDDPGGWLTRLLLAVGLMLLAAASFPVVSVFSSLGLDGNSLSLGTSSSASPWAPPLAQATPRPAWKLAAPRIAAPVFAALTTAPTGGFAMEEPPPAESVPPEQPELLPQPPAGTLPPHSPRTPARPDAVRGIYLTGWVAGSPSRLRPLLDLVAQTELNTVVIEIKDELGRLSYRSSVPLADQIGASQAKIANIKGLIAELKRRGIYVIARQVVFKDLALASARPSWATQSAPGRVWRDSQGLAWTDPYNRQVWDYNIAIAKEAAHLGFDEIQFDYVRFPDTPRAHALFYPAQAAVATGGAAAGGGASSGAAAHDAIAGAGSGSAPPQPARPTPTRASAVRAFLAQAHAALHPMGVAVSADVFGLVTSAQDDLGIGQRLEELAPVVDYLNPMVYPSHYALGTYGLANPDVAPYQTVYNSLTHAIRRLKAIGLSRERLVPWLQDFSLRAKYGPGEVRAQIKAAYDLGINEWFLWNPANVYTRSAFKAP